MMSAQWSHKPDEVAVIIYAVSSVLFGSALLGILIFIAKVSWVDNEPFWTRVNVILVISSASGAVYCALYTTMVAGNHDTQVYHTPYIAASLCLAFMEYSYIAFSYSRSQPILNQIAPHHLRTISRLIAATPAILVFQTGTAVLHTVMPPTITNPTDIIAQVAPWLYFFALLITASTITIFDTILLLCFIRYLNYARDQLESDPIQTLQFQIIAAHGMMGCFTLYIAISIFSLAAVLGMNNMYTNLLQSMCATLMGIANANMAILKIRMWVERNNGKKDTIRLSASCLKEKARAALSELDSQTEMKQSKFGIGSSDTGSPLNENVMFASLAVTSKNVRKSHDTALSMNSMNP